MKKISLFLFTLFVFLNFMACKDTNTTAKNTPPRNTISIEENVNKVDEIIPSEKTNLIEEYDNLVCLGEDDNQITDFRAGLFVPGSLPVVERFDSSLTSKVEFIKNGEYFDILFNYYKNGDKLVAQYECPKAIQGDSFDNSMICYEDCPKECYIENKDNKYISSEDCKPILDCQNADVKLKIFSNFLSNDNKNNEVIKTFEIKNNNPCSNSYKLQQAAKEGDLEQIKQLLDKTDINMPSATYDDAYEGNFFIILTRPLLSAIENDKTEAAKFLLENGAIPDLKDVQDLDSNGFEIVDNFNALSLSIEKGNNEIINLILPIMKSKKEALVVATCKGNDNVVKEILKEDTSSVDMESYYKYKFYTPLGCAIENKDINVLKTLISYGVDLNKEIPTGGDPTHTTALETLDENNDVQLIELLKANGAKE